MNALLYDCESRVCLPLSLISGKQPVCAHWITAVVTFTVTIILCSLCAAGILFCLRQKVKLNLKRRRDVLRDQSQVSLTFLIWGQ